MKERRAARRAISAVPFCKPWGWEDESFLNSFPPMELCLAEVKKSDALVLILGSDLTRNTYLEFKEATGKHRMVLNKQCGKSEKARRFLRRVRRQTTCGEFHNLAELKTWIINGLMRWFKPVEAMRFWSETRIRSQIPYPDLRIHEAVIRRRRRQGK